MKRYEIWVGQYNLGQGYGNQLDEPWLVATYTAIDFKTACMKYELEHKLKSITEAEASNTLNMQSYGWWFNENTISNSWTGKYFETREEALKTFNG